jgi:4-amino-4-deoxy-L-arabinose transferase-like glycosyltransferase
MMIALYNRRILILALITILAFAIRFYRLDAAGLSEDESHKMAAARAYQQGDFTVNLEHPMLMKLLATASLTVAERWQLPVTAETALRLPNVIFGSLTCLVLYLFFSDMFGFRIGLLTALLWAINLNAIMINRVAKEDTLLVFFLWLAYYFCFRAKKAADRAGARKKLLYSFSGVNYGLMIASKYFPHYMGLNFLYYHLIGPNRWNTRINRRHLLIFFAALTLTFLLANPAILSLNTIKYMIGYVHEETQTHHGYWMMGHLYRNDASNQVDTTPTYFYLLALAVKTPLPLFLAFIAGLVELFRRRNDDNYFFVKFMLLVWIIPYSLFGAKWLRYILAFIPLMSVTAAIGLSVGYDYCRAWLTRNGADSLSMRAALAAAGFIIFLIAPTITTVRAAPFYSLYVSPLCGGSNYIGYYFPHDEFYDLGMREAVQYVARQAEPEAVIANEAPGVINYYRQEFGRCDLKSAAMSDQGFQFPDGPTYVLIQDGRRYFENEGAMAYVETNYLPVKEVKVWGASAVKIYKISGREEHAQASQRAASAALIIE